MSEATVFSTISGDSVKGKVTGPEVVEVCFNSATYMVSPHPERGNALALTMQGQSMAIHVATLLVKGGSVSEAIWEVPFSGRPPEWQDALLDLVSANAGSAVLAASGGVAR